MKRLQLNRLRTAIDGMNVETEVQDKKRSGIELRGEYIRKPTGDNHPKVSTPSPESLIKRNPPAKSFNARIPS